MADHDSQVLKGILSMLLLQVLSEHEDYGYSVVVRLQDLGFHGIAEGTVYPALSRLEAKGLLTSRLEPSQAGPARKYYRPTRAGLAELDRAVGSWISLRANVDRVMTPKPTPTNEVRSEELPEVTHRISYRTDGDPGGAPLVLLDGFSRWADNWWEVGYVGELRDAYRVIAIDRLGHGDSDKPHDAAEYLEHLIVSDIVAVLDAESVDSALIWGFSMGARNAASLAVMEPARVGALVLGGGAPMPASDGRRERVMAWADLIRTEDGMRRWLRSIGAAEDSIEESLARNDPAALSAAVAGTADWAPVADDIDAPSLWYVGSDDDGGFSAEELEVAGRLGVETHSIPGADHVASFRRMADVLRFVRPFLDHHRP